MTRNESPAVERERIKGSHKEPSQRSNHVSVSSDQSPDEFALKVSKACALQSAIEAATAELGTLKAELREEAQRRLPAGKKRNPAGETVVFNGAQAGESATVRFPRPSAISAFWFKNDLAWRYKDSEVVCIGDLRKFAGEKFESLFYTQHRPTKKFADVVAGLVRSKELTKGNGERLVEMCLEEATPRVELATSVAATAPPARIQ